MTFILGHITRKVTEPERNLSLIILNPVLSGHVTLSSKTIDRKRMCYLKK